MNDFSMRSIFQRPTLITVGVCIFVFSIYLVTMPRELSWGYVKLGIDSPELLTASSLFGIAHPPGYPVYTILLGLLMRVFYFVEAPLLGNVFSILCFVSAIPFLIRLMAKISRAIYPEIGLITAYLC